MSDQEKYAMYERCIPTYLKHDIDEYLKYKDDKTCSYIDCLLDEIYGSINSAFYSDEITEEQADYLRDKYCYGCDWSKGERTNYGHWFYKLSNWQ